MSLTGSPSKTREIQELLFRRLEDVEFAVTDVGKEVDSWYKSVWEDGVINHVNIRFTYGESNGRVWKLKQNGLFLIDMDTNEHTPFLNLSLYTRLKFAMEVSDQMMEAYSNYLKTFLVASHKFIAQRGMKPTGAVPPANRQPHRD
jgi:hypothetical protein